MAKLGVKISCKDFKLATLISPFLQVVVKFSATWCKNCKEIAGTYRELSDKYPSLIFLTVDVDEMPVSMLSISLPKSYI